MPYALDMLAFSVRPVIPGLRGLGWALVPLAVAVAVYYAWLYRLDGRRLSRRQVGLLWALRAGVGAIVLAMLLRPAVQLTRHEEKTPVVALLLDESSSMKYPEALDHPLTKDLPKDQRSRGGSALEALDLLQGEFSRRHRVKVFTFSDTLGLAQDIPDRGEKTPPLPRQRLLEALKPFEGHYTEGGDAVRGTLDQLVGEKVSAVVLLSDGRNTGGEPFTAAAERAVAAGVPVAAMAFGSAEPLIDLRIDRVDAPAEASLGDVLPIYVRVTNHVRPGLKVALTLTENGQVDQEKTLTLAAGENAVTISTIPRTEGLREYRLSLPPQDHEIDYANNAATFYVKVVKRTLRVLFVAGKATREYQHAVLCMLRDPVVRLSCFLQSGHVDYVQQGNVVIDRLPRTVAQWAEYDVVILYDVDPKDISTQQISGLENTVSKGAGLMVVAGRTYGIGALVQMHANKMRQLLPVEVDKSRPPRYEVVFSRPVKVERTSEAKGSKVFRLAASEQLNEEIWACFPALYWYQPVEQVKPRAISVLRKAPGGPPEFDDAGECIMAIQRFGEGLVAYLGTDETWRWRNPYGTHDYDLFWGHLLRYLGETRLLGAQKQVSLTVDKPVYAPGESAVLKLTVLDYALLEQLRNERLAVTVIDPTQGRQVVPLERDPGGEPFYQGQFPTRRVGPHLVEARHSLSTADTEAKSLYEAQESFKVEMVPLEAVDTTADLEGMRQLAEATGGTYLDHRTMDEGALRALVAATPAEKLRIPTEQVLEVWDTPAILAWVLGLLTVEWSLRKLWGVL